MPPPPNQTALTAINLGAFPASTTQDVHDAGTTYDVWFKFTASQTGLVGLWARDNALLFNYDPQISIWLGPASAPVSYLGINTSGQLGVPVQFEVQSGVEYFILCETNNPTVSPAVLAIDAEFFAPQGTPEGTILVSDVTGDRPLIFLSGTVDYEVLDFLNDYSDGEGGDINSDNIACHIDIDGIGVWDINTRTLIAMLPYVYVNFPAVRVHRATGKFYVARDTGPSVDATTVLANGTFGPTTWNPSVVSLDSIAPNVAETILYYASGGFPDSSIKRWDLATDSALSNLAAAVANHRVVDIIVLDDESVLVLYWNPAGATNVQVRHYDSAGVLLNTFSGIDSSATAPRMAYDLNNNDHFWLMTHPGDGINRFLKIRVADGVVITTRDHSQFEGSVYQGIDYTDPARYGSSNTCPFYLLFAGGVGDGTLIVQKVTNPTPDVDDTEFTIDETVTPGSIVLKDGEEETFLNVTPGTYSVVEQVNANYITTYEVSNDPSNDNENIIVGSGETVTVIITNTRRGSITVGKMTNPFDEGENEFDFTADAPLSPTSFSLASDEEQQFLNLAPGIYSLREETPTDFTPVYLFSNASTSPEAISVAAGENVTVAVLNTLQASGTGLYQIVPGKRTDTVVNQNQQLVTKKIPNPFFITAFFQDL